MGSAAYGEFHSYGHGSHGQGGYGSVGDDGGSGLALGGEGVRAKRSVGEEKEALKELAQLSKFRYFGPMDVGAVK